MKLQFPHPSPPTFSRLTSTSLLLFAAASACTVRGDVEYENQLDDDIRILAMRSEPAAIAPGETATFSALIHEPTPPASCRNAEIEYAWRWCPLRGDANLGFACLFDESLFEEIWDTFDLEGDAPSFDLGEAAEPVFNHDIPVEALQAACSLSLGGEFEDEMAIEACVASLEPSAELTVKWCGQQRSAIKTFELLSEVPEDGERNENPDPTGSLTFRLDGIGPNLPGDTVLKHREYYSMTASFDTGTECGEDDAPELCLAQTFLPEPEEGLPTPVPRRETLVMSWYLSRGSNFFTDIVGEARDTDADNAFSEEDDTGGVQTVFVDGETEFEDLGRNVIELAEDLEGGPGDVYLVLRDERGGIGWTHYEITVEEAK